MVKIFKHAHAHFNCVPLVMRVVGDGRIILRVDDTIRYLIFRLSSPRPHCPRLPLMHMWPPTVCAGQSCITGSYLKRYWPDNYKHILITNGHFHSHGHFMLQGVTLFWHACYARYDLLLSSVTSQTPTPEPTCLCS